MQLTIIQMVILFLIAYVCLYGLVDRIMKCIEHCATAKAYGKFAKGEAHDEKRLDQK